MDLFPADDQPFDYDDVANQLLAEGADKSPSYLHGGICGIYAGAGPVGPEDCVAGASQALDLGLHGELAETSVRLADVTRRALPGEEFDFQLFLPDDEVEMPQRVRALSEWCQGFMAAFALMAADSSGAGLGEETSEILKDIAAIAQAGHEGDEADGDEEEAESHFFELTEYLRFAAMNMYLSRLLELESAEAAGSEGGD